MNPKRYGSYDQCISNCKICKSALLYKGCSFCHDRQSCAGYDTPEGATSCCQCYEESEQSKIDKEAYETKKT